MIRHLYSAVVLTLLVNVERTFCLKPPKNVKIVKSELQWKSPEDDGVLYSLQYKHNVTSKSEDDWHNVSNYIGTTLERFIITTEYYGAVFRVRAEKGNDTSEWVNSSLVQCINVEFLYCVPVISLSVKPEMVFLKMGHMDESLEKEHGGNLEFIISYWKEDDRGKSEVKTLPSTTKNEEIHDLESGKNYCFQVAYLYYHKTTDNVSEKRCAIIPETPEVAKQRALLFGLFGTLLVVAACGVCIFSLFRNYKKIKQFLRPLPLEIPRHYEEFLSGEFPIQVCRSPSSQSLRSYDMITVIEDNNLEQNV